MLSITNGGVMHYSPKYKFLFFIIFIVLTTGIGFSQEGKAENHPRAAQYFLGTGDELLIKVNIWGFVNKPGQYMVPSDTDLISLISYAGGPKKGAKLSNIKIVHSEKKTNNKENISRINVSKFLTDGNQSLIPQLKPGDTIVISGSKWHYLNSFLEFTTKVAILVQIYGWVIYYNNR